MMAASTQSQLEGLCQSLHERNSSLQDSGCTFGPMCASSHAAQAIRAASPKPANPLNSAVTWRIENHPRLAPASSAARKASARTGYRNCPLIPISINHFFTV